MLEFTTEVNAVWLPDPLPLSWLQLAMAVRQMIRRHCMGMILLPLQGLNLGTRRQERLTSFEIVADYKTLISPRGTWIHFGFGVSDQDPIMLMSASEGIRKTVGCKAWLTPRRDGILPKRQCFSAHNVLLTNEGGECEKSGQRRSLSPGFAKRLGIRPTRQHGLFSLEITRIKE